MVRAGSRRWGIWGTVAVVVMSAAGLTGPGAAATAPVQVPARADGFRVEAASTYTWDPPARAVHVAVDMTVTNQRPDQAVAGGVRQFYLPDYSVTVLAEAVGLRAVKSDGTTLPWTGLRRRRRARAECGSEGALEPDGAERVGGPTDGGGEGGV